MALIPSSLEQVRRQVASLSNSASWQSLTTASITSGLATLTFGGNEQPFTSTAIDKNKTVVIRGAGSGGADLITAVLSVTNSTTATVTDNASATVSNALCALGGDYDDDRHSLVEIDECIFEADDTIVLAIQETLDHWARLDYVQLSGSITSGAKLPSHTNVIGEPLIQNSSGKAYLPATRADLKAIQRYNENTGTPPFSVYGASSPTTANSPLAGYFHIDPDGYIYYTGLDCKVRYFQLTRTATALQSPQVYQSAIVAGAMARLLLKDGNDVTAAGGWGKFWQDGLSAVRMGAMQSMSA